MRSVASSGSVVNHRENQEIKEREVERTSQTRERERREEWDRS